MPENRPGEPWRNLLKEKANEVEKFLQCPRPGVGVL